MTNHSFIRRCLLLLVLLTLPTLHLSANEVEASSAPSQERLQQLLAPIALYPDTVLTHVLIASTYPLEIVQADRWARAHAELKGQDAVEAAQDEPWDLSVKALLAFPDLLSRMSEDLLWTQELGEAFLASEEATMDAVQALRQKALEHGTLDDMEHQTVIREEEQIIIQPVRREVVYVPYYDTRYVYGNWAWVHYPPVYWAHPPHYHGGFYWGFYAPVGDWFYFSGFHWGYRTVVISHSRPYYYSRHRHYGYRPNHVEHWHHNPHHRRNVRYHSDTNRHQYGSRHHQSRSVPGVQRQQEVQRQLQHHRSREEAVYGQSDRRHSTHPRQANQSREQQPARTAPRQQYNQSARERAVHSGQLNARVERRPAETQTQSTARRVTAPSSTNTRTAPPQRATPSRTAPSTTLQRATNNSRPVSRSAPSTGGNRGGRLER